MSIYLDNIPTRTNVLLNEIPLPYIQETDFSTELYKDLLKRVSEGKVDALGGLDPFINKRSGSTALNSGIDVVGGLIGKFYSGSKLPKELENLNSLAYGTKNAIIIADEIKGGFVGSYSDNITIFARKISGSYLCSDANNPIIIADEINGFIALSGSNHAKLITKKVTNSMVGHNAKDCKIAVTDELKDHSTLKLSSDSILVANRIINPKQGRDSENLTIFAAEVPKGMFDPQIYSSTRAAPKKIKSAIVRKEEFSIPFTPATIDKRIEELQKEYLLDK